MTARLAWALRLARCGFSIFPILPGTKSAFYPGESQWPRLMSRDEATIRRWFAEREGMNYGVCPGDGAGVVDLDRKPQKDGIAAFELLALEHDGDPGETFVVESASGGRHLYFRTPFRASNANRFPDGIDTRGAGGYVVGPGSELIAGKCDPKDTPGRYEVVHGTPEGIAPAPPWILESWKRDDRKDRETEPVFELDTPAAISRASELLRRRAPAVEDQGGDEHTYATFCLLRDCGVSEAKAVELAAELWNDRCAPPWDIDGLDSLSAKARNAYRYAVNRPASKGGSPEEVFGEIGEGDDRPRDVATDPEPAGDRWSKLIKIGAAIRDIKPIPQLIDGWLPARGITAVIAQRGDGKTVLLLDLALRMAYDLSWHGLAINGRIFPIYLCGEDVENAAAHHHKAWCLTHAGDSEPDNFAFVMAVPRLLDPEQIGGFVRAMRPFVPAGRQVVLFVDTWQRGVSGTSQNDEDKMALAIENVERLAACFGNCPVLVAFHPPKSARGEDLTITGSGWQENATHAIWKLFPDKHAPGAFRLLVDRIKGPGRGSHRVFTWREVEIGRDKRAKEPLKGIVAEIDSGEGRASGFADDPETLARLISDRINSPERGREQGHPLSLRGLRGIVQDDQDGGALLREAFKTGFDYRDGTRLVMYHKGRGARRETWFRLDLAEEERAAA